MAVPHISDERTDRRRVTDVHLGGGPTDCVRSLPGGIDIQVGEHDVGAFLGEPPGTGPADAGRCAGHHTRRSFELHERHPTPRA